jgi:hypothetical protein
VNMVEETMTSPKKVTFDFSITNFSFSSSSPAPFTGFTIEYLLFCGVTFTLFDLPPFFDGGGGAGASDGPANGLSSSNETEDEEEDNDDEEEEDNDEEDWERGDPDDPEEEEEEEVWRWGMIWYILPGGRSLSSRENPISRSISAKEELMASASSEGRPMAAERALARNFFLP